MGDCKNGYELFATKSVSRLLAVRVLRSSAVQRYPASSIYPVVAGPEGV